MQLRRYLVPFTVLLFTWFSLTEADCKAQGIEQLNGSWSLDLETKEPAWMSVFEKEGELYVAMRIYVGSAGPYKVEEVRDGKVCFQLKPKRRKDKSISVRRSVEVALEGGIDEGIAGVIYEQPTDGNPAKLIRFVGNRIPPMPSNAPNLSAIQFGERIALFNGKDLSGWRTHETDKKNGWSVENGELTNTTPKTDFSATGAYANLRTVEEFEDFRLHIEFLVEENRNSGIYLRGMYEAQVVDRDSRMQGIQGPGAIFGLIAPTKNAGKSGGQWQSYDLTLVDRHITVVLNGETVIDNQPATGPTAGAIYTDPSKPGPIYLQGDHTNVKYRNITLEPVLTPK